MNAPKKVLVLGSTGSIGVQTLDVARRHPDAIEICGLAAGTRTDDLLAQAREFGVTAVAVGDARACDTESAGALRQMASCADGYFGMGEEGVVRLIDESGCDVVVNSLVGAQGLKASYEALKGGKRLALANKESLVVGGDVIMPLARRRDASYPSWGEDVPFRPEGTLVPIDSEHGAIFQCLLGETMSEVDRLWVTASGGPFRGKGEEELRAVTAADALAHPTWNMGPKITIDSSTLMNKGLEVIEAHHLFDVPYERIEVVVQPQSAIHSMVEFADGSVKAHLGATDMRIPIQFALSYPARWDTPVSRLDFRTLGSLDFSSPDTAVFRCLDLAFEAGRAGGTLPAAMNAANEVAVAAFLAGACGWLDIAGCVDAVMSSHDVHPASSIDQLIEVDAAARAEARSYLRSL